MTPPLLGGPVPARRSDLAPANPSSSTSDCAEGRFQSPSTDQIRRAAELFAALSHEGRLQVLLCLSRSPGLSVSELLLQVGGQQSALSHQLRILKQARLVKSQRSGRHVIYQLYDKHISHVVADTLAHVSEE